MEGYIKKSELLNYLKEWKNGQKNTGMSGVFASIEYDIKNGDIKSYDALSLFLEAQKESCPHDELECTYKIIDYPDGSKFITPTENKRCAKCWSDIKEEERKEVNTGSIFDWKAAGEIVVTPPGIEMLTHLPILAKGEIGETILIQNPINPVRFIIKEFCQVKYFSPIEESNETA
jgi:hypothetical protein